MPPKSSGPGCKSVDVCRSVLFSGHLGADKCVHMHVHAHQDINLYGYCDINCPGADFDV